MIENSGAPLPSPTTPTKLQPWVIVVAVLVVMCCFCVGATGLLFAFGGPILDQLGVLHSQLPVLLI